MRVRQNAEKPRGILKAGLRITALALSAALVWSGAAASASSSGPAVTADPPAKKQSGETPSEKITWKDEIKGKPYEEAVKQLFEKGILAGDVDGRFYPDTKLTRAQACIIIVKALKPSEDDLKLAPTSKFRDLAGYGWAAPYINYAAEKGIAAGTGPETFHPANSVKTNELVTFALRAGGYGDAALGGTWPENYIQKAREQGLYKGLTGQAMESPDATKGTTAQIVWNGLPLMEKPVKPVQPATPAAVTGYAFSASGRFDRDVTAYDGKKLAPDAVVRSYDYRKNYSESMKLPQDTSSLRKESTPKYRNTETPAWYKIQNGLISEMIVPGDVGFSGYAYVFINSIEDVAGGEGKAVKGFDTLTAGRPVLWAAAAGMTGALPPGEGQYKNGSLFELRVINGMVENIAVSGSADIQGKYLKEIRANDTLPANAYQKVKSVDGNRVIGLLDERSGVKWYPLAEKVTVCFYETKEGKYVKGTLAGIRADSEVRLYDLSEGDGESVSIAVVKK